MSATRSVYKVLRSLVFTTVLVVIGLVALLYIAMSVPAVQNLVCQRAERELSDFLGGRVEISSVELVPFNEVRLYGVSLYTPQGERCLSAGKIGAGISLWPLLSSGTVEIVYAELISLDAKVVQPRKNAPLNIDYLIQAFSPKDKNKPPAKFRVKLRNVVIRKSRLSFDRPFMPRKANGGLFDPNHVSITNLRADVELPLLTNDDFTIDLRRIAFDEKSGFSVGSLSMLAHITPREISFSNFKLRLDQSDISISDQKLSINGYGGILDALKKGSHSVSVTASPLMLSELSPFYAPLASFDDPGEMSLNVSGNMSKVSVDVLKIEDYRNNILLDMAASFDGLSDISRLSGDVEHLKLAASASFISRVAEILPLKDGKVGNIIDAVGNLDLSAAGKFDLEAKVSDVVAEIATDIGALAVDGDISWSGGNRLVSNFIVKTDNIDLGTLLAQPRLGMAALEAEGNIALAGKNLEGDITAVVPMFDWNSNRFENISLKARKEGEEIMAHVEIDDRLAALKADANCLLAGTSSLWSLDADIAHLFPSAFGVAVFKPSDMISGKISGALAGNAVENLSGNVELLDFNLKAAKSLHFDRLMVSAGIDGEERYYSVDSDYLYGNLRGVFNPLDLTATVRNLVARAAPSFIKAGKERDCLGQNADFSFTVNPSDDLYTLIGAPVRPGVPVTIRGNVDGTARKANLAVDAPYLIQGRDKLIRNTKIAVSLDSVAPARIHVNTDFPLKNDRALVDLQLEADNDRADANLAWAMEANASNKGRVGLFANISRNELDRSLAVDAGLNRSGFSLNGADWDISPAAISYAGKELDVSGLRISHDSQFVDIHGRASVNPDDRISVELSEINLKYIFDILNINHVDFGGIATGKAHVSSLFTKTPVALTDGLFVKDLTYNGCVLGDGHLESHWDNDERMVAINADIDGPDDSSATVRGGVYVTRDSLSFDFGAKKIDIEFLGPFMSGFTSSVKGRASGNLKLYGTFSDIDLAGAAYADEITMLVDYTNVYYTGSDSIFFSPGRIYLPHIQLHDRYGNTCNLRGEVTHEFLKNPKFNFNVSDVKHMLVYDTGPKMNPRWYGHVFADGSASIRGVPGLVSVNIRMTTAPDSEFTLVLDETQEAEDYTFLTFSDRRREACEKIEIKETFEDRFKKNLNPVVNERPDLFVLDMALDVTPGAKMVIVMDPQAGDKIVANGAGALQMGYNSQTDEFSIYGKYTLNNGTYNFSLQELILKNFKIQPGSSISFNGDPLQGILDITAAYRVNTNLKDLDRSFETDPDLNRTSVPVDALLKVTGDIHAPEIKFDLKLPTVTSEVERKVRSIISTEDMMNRQIIYLLALNRFYTPEYMGAEQGGEIASVASSTLSSQLQNIIGSLTDKFSVAPSIKSEKSDLSDMEVDVALSSSLFDDRLLINGNLGYRDRSTSQTTFIGDFDLEYLLSRDGRLRLKAYNHFNDASYYLKSALTTQGIGIVYRKEFDDPFTFLKRKNKRKKKSTVSTESGTRKSPQEADKK